MTEPLDKPFFRGRWAILCAICLATWGALGAIGIALGGQPLAPETLHDSQNVRYVLSDHGTQTDVSRGAWEIARVCTWAIPLAWLSSLACMAAVFVQNVLHADDYELKDHSRLIFMVMVIAMVALLAALIIG